MNQVLSEIIPRLTWALAGAVGLILLGLAGLALLRPIIVKLGLRNVPRRRSQSALIVLGLTLSTIIITASLATGDTLQYSVRQHAVDAYGEIDEVLAPPLLSGLISLTNSQSSTPQGGGNVTSQGGGADQIARLLGSQDIFSLLDTGLPGIPVSRYEELRRQASQEPLIDKTAPAIVFPTIIRNVSTGQGEPFGFIFAVDDQYDGPFGLHTVEGQPVTMGGLRAGAGSLFQQTANLLTAAGQGAADLGLGSIKLSDVARGVAAAGGALSSQPVTGTAALTGLLPAAGAPVTATQAITGAGTGLLSGLSLGDINLVALRGEIDRVLGEVGLEVRQGDVYLSRLGAEKLAAHPGDLLEIYIGPVAMPYRVKGIVDEAGPLAALAPVAVMRLDEAQRLLFMQGKVNVVLVSNAGDREGGIPNTTAVSARLRQMALNDAALEKVAGILRGPEGTRAISEGLKAGFTAQQHEVEESNQALAFFARGALPGPDLDVRLAALQRELSTAGDADGLRTILSDADVRSWLRTLALPAEQQAELAAALAASSEFEVVDLLNKATVVTVAEVGGGVFSTLFSICSTFSILAGVLLIFLIFVMLAAERKSELGMARAVGMQRGHLVQMFVAEGLVYDLAAAALGLGLGLLISYAMIGYLSGLFRGIGQQFGSMAGVFRFYFHVTNPSLVISYCLGVLLTFGVVVIASWRVSRLNIVAAIRDLGDETDTRGERPWLAVVGLIVRGPLLLAAGILLMVTGSRQELTRVLIGATCVLTGAAQLLDWALGRWTGMRPASRARLTYSLTGAGLLALWGLPWDRLLPAAPAAADVAAVFSGAGSTALYFILSAPLLIVGAILLVVFNADSLAWGISHLLAPLGRLAPVFRLAVAYPLNARFRTGMAMLLFAMVITTVVVMSIVIQATQTLVTPGAESTAGFDIVSRPTLLSMFNPAQDLAKVLHAQTEVPQADIAAWGAVSGESVEARLAADGQAATETEGWRELELTGLDDGYLAQAASIYTFDRRAEGYADDAAVWQALRERDDVAVLDRYLVAGRPAEDGSPSLAPGVATGDGGLQEFRLQGLDLNSRAPLPQLELELRPGQNGARAGQAQRVRVIAVYHQAGTLAGSGLHLNMRGARKVTGRAEPNSYYIKTRAGADVKQVAQGLERALVPYGQDVTPLADTFSQGREVARGILQLVQGFMALGLLVGIAALGVISSRTVVERRQQIGMLRAIGFQPGPVAFSFLLESSFIALTGILTGTLVGVLIGRQMIGGLLSFATPGMTVPVPWASIGGVLLLAYLFSLLTTLLPALQASRIYPAEALRYE